MHHQQLLMEVMKLVWANRLLNFHQIKEAIGVCLIMFVWMTICNDAIGVVDTELILTDYEKINIKVWNTNKLIIIIIFYKFHHLTKFYIKFHHFLDFDLDLRAVLRVVDLRVVVDLRAVLRVVDFLLFLPPSIGDSAYIIYIFLYAKKVLFLNCKYKHRYEF